MSSWSKNSSRRTVNTATLKRLDASNLPSYWYSQADSSHEPAFHYITVATIGHPNLDKLQAQVKSKGENLLVLGSEMKKPIGWRTGGNFGVKLLETFNFLLHSNLDPNDIILFSDAFDVAYVGEKQELISRFEKFTKPIVFGAEKLCSPDKNLEGSYPPSPTDFRFLNSGGFIGRVWALRRCMSDYAYSDLVEDQRFWTKKFLENLDLIELDYENRIFLNCVDVPKEEIFWDGITAYHKHSQPLVIHANGSDKSYVDIFQRNL